METEPQIQDRIRAVYCFDGPGFREDIYRKESYLRIEKKIIKMVPQDSFVGMLLHTAGSYQVVESSGKGVLQHDMFTWVVKEGDFVYKEEINPATEKKNQQINEWIASYSSEEQQEIVDALFEIIEATQADTVMDFTAEPFTENDEDAEHFSWSGGKNKAKCTQAFPYPACTVGKIRIY